MKWFKWVVVAFLLVAATVNLWQAWRQRSGKPERPGPLAAAAVISAVMAWLVLLWL